MNFKKIFNNDYKKEKIKKIFEMTEKCSIILLTVKSFLGLITFHRNLKENTIKKLQIQLINIDEAIEILCEIQKELLSFKF